MGILGNMLVTHSWCRKGAAPALTSEARFLRGIRILKETNESRRERHLKRSFEDIRRLSSPCPRFPRLSKRVLSRSRASSHLFSFVPRRHKVLNPTKDDGFGQTKRSACSLL